MPATTFETRHRNAQRLLARLMAVTPCSERASMLRDLPLHVGEALAVIEGRPAAAETLYGAADAFATRGR